MKGKAQRVRQFGELVKAVISALMNIWEEMATDVTQGWIENKEVLERALREALVLPTPPIDIIIADFFKVRRMGIYAESYFIERILQPALSENKISLARVGKPFDLPKDMAEVEIRKELGDRHIFDSPKAFCLYLASQIDKQWWGWEKGDLLTSGYANIFYVRGLDDRIFVIDVRWNSAIRRWVVDTQWLNDDHHWDGGSRAFPCLPEQVAV